MMNLGLEREEHRDAFPLLTKRLRSPTQDDLEVENDLKSQIRELKKQVDYLTARIELLENRDELEVPKKGIQQAAKNSATAPVRMNGTGQNPQKLKQTTTNSTVTDSTASPAAGDNSWIKVVKKGMKAQSTAKSSPDLMTSLSSLPPDAKMKILLKKTIPLDQKTERVVSVMAQLPLSIKAQRQPIPAWKEAIKALTGQSVLAVSLIHPCKAELFLDERVAEAVQTTLASKGYLVQDTPLLERDLRRRKTSYLHGYFRPLRRAMLLGFSPSLQEEMLNEAEQSLKTTFKDKAQQTQWGHHVAADRVWLKDLQSQQPQEEEVPPVEEEMVF
jgi:hypothetical protein